MSDEPFLDANILIYAHDVEAGPKHQKAKLLVQEIWRNGCNAFLSIQVLQEFHVNLVKKGVPVESSAQITRNYLEWKIVDNDKKLFLDSLSTQARWQLSYWDASIISAAKRAGVKVLWSEDFNDGQDYGGLRVLNPLKFKRDSSLRSE